MHYALVQVTYDWGLHESIVSFNHIMHSYHSLHVVELVFAFLQFVFQFLFALQIRTLLRQETTFHLQLQLLPQAIHVRLRVFEHLQQ